MPLIPRPFGRKFSTSLTLFKSRPFQPGLFFGPILFNRISGNNEKKKKVQHDFGNHGRKLLVLVDDHLILQQLPLSDVINNIVQVLVKSNNSDLRIPAEIITEKWRELDNSTSLHDKMMKIYYPFFQSDLKLFIRIFKNPDLNLNLILRQFYMKTCNLGKLDIIETLTSIPSIELKILKNQVWDTIKMNYKQFLIRKTRSRLSANTITTDIEQELKSLKNYRILIITDQQHSLLQFSSMIRNYNSNLLVIQLQKHSSKTQLTKLISDFKFFERLHNIDKMQLLHHNMIHQNEFICCDFNEFKDIMYLLRRGSELNL